MDPGETPVEAALREFVEETQYAGSIEVWPLGLYQEPHFEYYSYIGLVPKEFAAMLDWENEDAGWFALDRLPVPLHPGASHLFGQRWEAIAAATETA